MVVHHFKNSCSADGGAKNIRRKAANSVCRKAKKSPQKQNGASAPKKIKTHSAAGAIIGAKCAKLMFKRKK
jgi:hypothetical protein